MFMKYILIATYSIFILTACGSPAPPTTASDQSDSTLKEKPEQEPKAQRESESKAKLEAEQRAKESAAAQITKSGGLGDTKQSIEKNYGKNQNKNPDSSMGAYKDGMIVAMYLDDIAWNVTRSFEVTPQRRVTKDDAKKAVQDVIPNDAVQVKEWTQSEGKDVIQYESKKLTEVLGNDHFSFNGTNPGTFIVILKYDAKGVFAAIAAAGNKP